MKTLYLLRHATADRGDPSLGDFERPLAPRGVMAAARVGAAMRARHLIPAFVLCSEARRALETWSLVERELRTPVPAKVLRGLYLAPPGGLLEAVRRVPDRFASALAVGHNPGIERLVALLAGPGSEPRARRRLAQGYPTTALAVIAFDVERWPDAAPGRGRLSEFLRPRDLE